MKTRNPADHRDRRAHRFSRSADKAGATRRAAATVVESLEARQLLAVVSVNDVTAAEPADGGSGVARFTVRLDAPATQTVQVSYQAVQSVISTTATQTQANPIVRPVAAVLGSDFTTTSGTLVFNVGQQSKTVDVSVLPDTLRENDEFFELRLSNVQGATLGDVSGQAHVPLNDLGTFLDGYFTGTLSDLTDVTSRAFETIRNGITGAFEDIALPLVGGDFDRHLEPILSELESWETRLNRELESIFASAQLGDEARTMDVIRSTLFTTFGPSGLNVLKDGLDPGNGLSVSDIRLTYAQSNSNTTSYLQYDLNLGQFKRIDIPIDLSGVDFPQTLALDIDLDTSNGLRVEMKWDVRLGFGFSDAYAGKTVYLDGGAAATDFLGNGQKVPEFLAEVKVASAPAKDANGQDLLSGDFGFKGDITLGLGTGRATDGVAQGVTVTAVSTPNTVNTFGGLGKDGAFHIVVETRDTPTSALRTGTFLIDLNDGTLAQPGVYVPLILLALASNPQLSAFFPTTPFPAIGATLDFSRIDPYFNPGVETLPVLKLNARIPQIESLTVFGGEEFGFLTDTRLTPPAGVPAGTGGQVDDVRSVGLGFRAGQTSSPAGGRHVITAVRPGPSKGRLLDDPNFRLILGTQEVRVRMTEFGRRDIVGIADADVNAALGERSLETEVRNALRDALQFAGRPGDAILVSVDSQGRFVFSGTQSFRIEFETKDRTELTAMVAIDIGSPSFNQNSLNVNDERTFDRVFVSSFFQFGVPRIPFDVIRPSFSASANLKANVTLGVNDFGLGNQGEQSLGLAGDSLSLPEVNFDFITAVKATAKWNATTHRFDTENGLEDLQFSGVTLDVGGLLETVVKPVANAIGTVLSPISDIFGAGFNAAEGFINQPIPVLSELNGQPTSILDLAGGQTGLVGQLIDAFGNVIQLNQNLTRFIRDYDGSPIVFGDFVFDRQTRKLLPREVSDAIGGAAGISNNTFRQRFNTVSSASGGLKIDLLEPINIAKLLLGEDADVISYRLPRIDGRLGAGFDFDFGVVNLGLDASVDLFLDVGIGYDTRGIRSIVDAQRNGVQPDYADLLDGLFLFTRTNPTPGGPDLPEAEIKLGFSGTAGIDIYVAQGSVSANLQGRLAFNLIDPNPDGKLRWEEVVTITDGFNNPAQLLNLFDIQFSLSGGFDFAINILFGLVEFDSDDLPFDTDFEISVSLQQLLATFNLLPPAPPPPVRPPVLAQVVTLNGQQVLRLNAGPFASNRLYGDVDDNDTGAQMSVATSGADLVVFSGALGVPFSQGQRFPAAGISRILGVGTDLGDNFNTSGVTGTSASLTGGGGNDTIRAGGANDTIEGGAGDDDLSDTGGTNRIVTNGGDDTVQGGSGNDYIDASSATSAFIRPFGGDDLIIGSGGADRITSLDFANNPTGGRDTIYAGRGNDTIVGGTGNDSIDGGGGNDSIDGGAGNDTINAGDGDDSAIGGTGNDVLRGGLGEDTLAGGADNDELFGDEGRDSLTGNAGSDQMVGGGGNDTVSSAFADALLTGGLGENVLDINLAIDSPNTAFSLRLTEDGYADTNGFNSSSLDGFERTVLTTGSGNDTISVFGLDRTLTLNLGGGNDRVEYRQSTANLTINGDAGSGDRLVIEPFPITQAKQFTLASGSVSFDGATVAFTSIEQIELTLGRSDDVVTVSGTASGSSTTIRGGLGSDRVSVSSITGPLNFIGGTNNARDDTGTDVLQVNIAGNPDSIPAGTFSGLTSAVEQLEVVHTSAAGNGVWRVEGGQVQINGRTLVSITGAERIRISDDVTTDSDQLAVVDTSNTPNRVVLTANGISVEQAREVTDLIRSDAGTPFLDNGFAAHANGAHILPSPDGRHVYFFSDAANGGNGSVQVYGRDDFTGDLFPISSFTGSALGISSFNQGSVVFHPSGSALVAYSSSSSSLRVINRDATTGALSAGQSIFPSVGGNTHIGSPIAFSNDGNNFYVAGQGVSSFSWNNATRQLTLLRSNIGLRNTAGTIFLNANSLALSADGNALLVGFSGGGLNGYATFARTTSNGQLFGIFGGTTDLTAFSQLTAHTVSGVPFSGIMGGSATFSNRFYISDIGTGGSFNPSMTGFSYAGGNAALTEITNQFVSNPTVLARGQALSLLNNGRQLVVPTQPTPNTFRGTSLFIALDTNGVRDVSVNPDPAIGAAAIASPDGRHLYSQDDARTGQLPTVYRQARFGVINQGVRSFVANQTLSVAINGYDDTFTGGFDPLYKDLAFAVSTSAGALMSFGRTTDTDERFQNQGIAHPVGQGLFGATSVVPWFLTTTGEQWMIVTSPVTKTLTRYRYQTADVNPNGSVPFITQFGAPVAVAGGRTPSLVVSEPVRGRLFVTATDGTLSVYDDNAGTGLPNLVRTLTLDAGEITALAQTNDGDRVIFSDPSLGTNKLNWYDFATNTIPVSITLARPYAKLLYQASTSDVGFLYAADGVGNRIDVYQLTRSTNAAVLIESQINGVGGVAGLGNVSTLTLGSDGKYLIAAGNAEDAGAVFALGRGGKLTFLQRIVNNAGGLTGLDGVKALFPESEGFTALSRPNSGTTAIVGNFSLRSPGESPLVKQVTIPTVPALANVTVTGLIGALRDLDVTPNIFTAGNQNGHIVDLIAPNGTTVRLMDLGTASLVDPRGVTFDDEAAASIVGQTGNVSGRFRPLNPLSAFDGIDPTGVWTMRVESGGLSRLNSFRLDIDAGVATTDVPYPITDNQTAVSTLRIPEDTSGLIRDVELQIDVPHTFIGDLVVDLVAPDGTRINLANRAGGGNDGFLGTTFDDDATTPVSSIGAGSLGGTFQPPGFLSAVNGTRPGGTWRLEVRDDAGGDVGEIRGWTLFLETTAGRSILVEGTGIERAAFTGGTASEELLVRNATWTGGLSVDLAGGDDRAVIDGNNAATILGGAGKDIIDLFNAAGTVTIDAGADNDFININNTTAGSNLNVNAGSGADEIRIDLLNTLGNATIGGGADGDVLRASTNGTALIVTGPTGGNGTVSFAGRFASVPYNGIESVVGILPPAIAITAPTIAEGQSITFGSTITGLGGRTVTRIDWDVDNDGIFGDAFGATPTFAWTSLYALGINDNGTYRPSARATFSDGTQAFGATNLVVTNTAPTIVIDGPDSFDQFTPQTFNFRAANDPGNDRVTRWRIIWESGDPFEEYVGSELTLTHVFTRSSAGHNLTVIAFDDDNAIIFGKLITVNPAAAPVRSASVDAPSINEGAAVTLTPDATGGSASSILATTINWGDGNIDVLPGLVTTPQQHVYPDDGTYDVIVSFTEIDGRVSAAPTIPLAVTDVAPAIASSLSASLAAEGSLLTLNASLADPGADVVTSWTIDWGDGTPPEVVAATPGAPTTLQRTHRYLANGTFNATVTATNEDGSFADAAGAVEIFDISPAVTLSSPAPVNEGVSVTLVATPSDPGDIVDTLFVDWGDGTGTFEEIENAGGFPRELRHVYRDSGTFTARVFGAAGGSTSPVVSRSISVIEVDPVPSIRIVDTALGNLSGTSTVPEGSVVNVELSTGETGNDFHSGWTVNWGDGQTSTVALDRRLDVRVQVRGSFVTLFVDGQAIGTYQYDRAIGTGGTGLSTEGGGISFDDLVFTSPTGTILYSENFNAGAGNLNVRSGTFTRTNNASLASSNALALLPYNATPTIVTATTVDLKILTGLSDPAAVLAGVTGYTINWGDGTTSQQTFDASTTADDLLVEHLYTTAGNFNVSVTLTGTLAQSETLASRVANSGTYSLTLPRLPSDGSTYRIDWGDGDVTDVLGNPAAGNVIETHNFAGAGHFRVVATRITPTATPGVFTQTVVDRQQVLAGDRGVRADYSASLDFAPTRNQRGLIIFDHTADNVYKFAGLLDTGGRREFVIGEMTPNGPIFGRTAQGPIVQTISHTYADDSGAANRTISASLTRVGTPVPAASPIALRVLNVSPSVDLVPPATISRNVSFNLGVLAVRDPGADTITSHTINWGDGSSQTFPGRPAISASAFTHTYANTGTFTITVTTVDEDGTFTAATVPVTVTLGDVTPPTIVGSQILFDDFQGLQVTFSEPLLASTVAAGDLQVLNLTTGATFVPVSFTLSGGNTIVIWRFNNPGSFLADGNYRFSFAASSVGDVANNGIAPASIQNATTFFLGGDTDRNKIVNFTDLLVVAQNYNASNRSFSLGNFDYSAGGTVSFADLLILAQRYNAALVVSPSITARELFAKAKKDEANRVGLETIKPLF